MAHLARSARDSAPRRSSRNGDATRRVDARRADRHDAMDDVDDAARRSADERDEPETSTPSAMSAFAKTRNFNEKERGLKAFFSC